MSRHLPCAKSVDRTVMVTLKGEPEASVEGEPYWYNRGWVVVGGWLGGIHRYARDAISLLRFHWIFK